MKKPDIQKGVKMRSLTPRELHSPQKGNRQLVRPVKHTRRRSASLPLDEAAVKAAIEGPAPESPYATVSFGQSEDKRRLLGVLRKKAQEDLAGDDAWEDWAAAHRECAL